MDQWIDQQMDGGIWELSEASNVKGVWILGKTRRQSQKEVGRSENSYEGEPKYLFDADPRGKRKGVAVKLII